MTDGRATGAPLAVPGLVYVAPTDALHPATVEIDAASGWRAPRGIRQWSHEASVARVTDLKESVRGELGLLLPHERIDEKKFPFAHRAAKSNPVVAVPHELVATLVGKGVRVHTIGYDKVTSGFFYFAEGGGEPVRVQGDLIEMLTPILQYGSANEDIERHMGRVVDRLLTTLSDGAVTEARVELADALPPLGKKGENATIDLAEFEAEAKSLAEPSKTWESRAKDLVAALEGATTRKESTVTIPLYGEARRVTRTEMELDVGGKRIVLPSRIEWVVSGEISEAPRAAAVAVAPVTAEVDDAWGAESAPARAAAVTPAKATPSPAPAVAKPAASPTPPAARLKTPSPTPAARLATPSPITGARLATPSPTAAAKAQPAARVGTMMGGISKPTPSPSPVIGKDTSSPVIEVKGEPSGAQEVRNSIEPAVEKPVSPAVVASRIASVSGSGSAPTPETSKPPEEKSVVDAAQAKAKAAEDARPPAQSSAQAESEEEDDEEEDDRRHLGADEKAARKASKAQRKAERAAARRAAAEAANKAANAPKPKEKRADKAETKPEKEKAAASKSARPAAKEKAREAEKPAATESTRSSFTTIAIVLSILLAAAAAIWWFVLRKH